MWIVWSRDSAAVSACRRRSYQRPDPDKHAEHVVARRRLVEVAAGRFEDEVDLLLRADAARASASQIGVSVVPTSVCPCQGMANITRPSVVCGTMMAASAGQKRVVEHQVDALARRDQGLRVRIGQPAHGIGERARGVHDHARADGPLPAALAVGGDDAVDEAVGALGDAGHL